jgi:hypothetical protein
MSPATVPAATYRLQFRRVNTLRAHDMSHIMELVRVELDHERAMEAA